MRRPVVAGVALVVITAAATARAAPSLPTVPTPVLAAAPASQATASGLRTTVLPTLASAVLGRSVGVTVLSAQGTVLLDRGGAAPHIPASTAKLLTAAAALSVLGARSTLATRVVELPTVPPAPAATPAPTATDARPDPARRLVLVGGGDATLQSGRRLVEAHPGGDSTAYARLDRLADRVKLAVGAGPVTLAVDDSAFSAPAVSPDWAPGYVPSGQVAPVHALSVDAGRVRLDATARVADPALVAGQRLATLLRTRGVAVSGVVTRAPVPATGSELARVESPPVEDLVERMLTQSDNDLAEALGRLVAARAGVPVTARGAGTAVIAAVARLGVPVTGASLLDASGLARGSRVPATTLARTLLAATSPVHPELRALLTGLPVAGATGTLSDRYPRGATTAAARGVVRAKTGTLTGVSTLAGVAQSRDGGLVVFALLADGVAASGTLKARAALDASAAALAACGCGARP